MPNLSNRRLAALLIPLLLLGFLTTVRAQDTLTVLSAKDLARVVPTSFYYLGQSAPTQMRNAAAVRLGTNRHIIAGLVDTSGYSTEVRASYEGFLITDSPIKIESSELGTGAYGFGFSSEDRMNIFDIGGKQVLTVESHKDQDLKRPRPLMMMKAADGVRLYDGRNYVTIAFK